LQGSGQSGGAAAGAAGGSRAVLDHPLGRGRGCRAPYRPEHHFRGVSTMRILTTGGTRGIGRATALSCAARGWATALGYRGDSAAAKDTLAAIKAAGGTSSVHAADISDPEQVAALFDAAAAAMGGLDGVVINAGIVAPVMPLAEMTPERIERMVRVNLTG